MKQIALIFAIIMGLSPTILTAQDASEWWVGKWAYDASWCVDPQAGELRTHPAPIEITSDTVFGLENTCVISAANVITESAAHMLLKCNGEGLSYKEERIFLRGENSIWMWFGSDAPLQFHFCN